MVRVPDDMASRLARLEARDAILALKARYWRAIDAGDADGVAACLTADATIDFEGMPRFDRAADFVAVVREAAEAGGAHHLHQGCNPQVTILSDEAAEGRWDIQYRGFILEPRMTIRMSGTYDDRYRREGDVWRIAAMRMRQASFLSETIDAGGTPHIVALPAGKTLQTLFPAENA